MTARERLQQLAEHWFLTEPVLFAVYCSHRLTMNANMLCALRSGKGRVEYNPTAIDVLNDSALYDLLRVEMIRILLQHPYIRQPLGCKPIIQHEASDMVIAPAYKMDDINLSHPEDFGLPIGQHYEWYANRLSDMAKHVDGEAPSEGDSDAGEQQGEDITMPISMPGENSQTQNSQQEKDDTSTGHRQEQEKGNSSNPGKGCNESGGDGEENDKGEGENQRPGEGKDEELHDSGDSEHSLEIEDGKDDSYTTLWEEDPFQALKIVEIIQSSTQWGSLPAGMVELIKKAAEGRIDYRGALQAFRASIISQKRHLTRMRPSRRFGFDQMGSHYDFTTRLLIAIDTSGSVTSENLGRYFRIITTFFKYGIQDIEVLMFDDDIKEPVMKLDEAKKNKNEFKIQGRGGTNFQSPIDYAATHGPYDGLIIITDGYAPVPQVPPLLKTKLLWVLDNENAYKKRYDNFRKTGRVCMIQV